jgi:replicative DNA helicase
MAVKKKIEFNLNDADMSLLPYSDSLERDVLAAILEMPDEYYPVGLKMLRAKGMFYDTLNAEIWETIQNVAKNERLSASAVVNIFQGKRDEAKLARVMSLCNRVTWKGDFTSGCLMLNEYWIKRTIHRLGYYVNGNAIGETDPLELLGIASESLDKIYRHISQMKEVTIKDAVKELAQEIHAISVSPDGMLGLKSSLNELNQVIKGYRKGNLIAVGGSTGEGKTTLECQELRHFIEAGIPAGCFTLEMKTSELLLIMACSALSLNTEDVLSGKLTGDQLVTLGNYIESIKKMPLKILDKPAIKIGELKSVARQWKKDFDIKILYVDHMHLMEGDVQYPNAEQKFTDIANQLKALAKELDIPIVALVQLNRKEKGDKKMHAISDIKYASGIEQACDVILLLYRPELYGMDELPGGESSKGFAKIHVGKLRLLPKYDVKCYFSGLHFSSWQEHRFGQKSSAGIKGQYQDFTQTKKQQEEDLPF